MILNSIIKPLRVITITLASAALCTLNIAYADGINFHNAVINATPPGVKTTAAYVEIHNNSDKDVAMISAKGDISDRIELHRHTMKDGLMSMHPVKEITTPAMSNITLSPGGYHIMIMNLKQAVNANSEHSITFTFSDGLEKTIRFTAYKPGTKKKSSHHNHGEHKAAHENNKHLEHSAHH